MIGWLIYYLLFYVQLENLSLIWRRHHCRWRAINLGLCSALRAFQQGGVFIVPHLLWHWVSVFPVSSDGPLRLNAAYEWQGDAEEMQSGSSRIPIHAVSSCDMQGDTEDLFQPWSSQVSIKGA
jgi:hypothetical protein